jgi:hypothetical protein
MLLMFLCFFFLFFFSHFIFYTPPTLSNGIGGKYLTNSWNYNEMQTRAHIPNFMHLKGKKGMQELQNGINGMSQLWELSLTNLLHKLDNANGTNFGSWICFGLITFTWHGLVRRPPPSSL